MVWLKNIYYKIVNLLRKKDDPEAELNERIAEMKKKDPFIYK